MPFTFPFKFGLPLKLTWYAPNRLRSTAVEFTYHPVEAHKDGFTDCDPAQYEPTAFFPYIASKNVVSL